jgi:hypothetical protein
MTNDSKTRPDLPRMGIPQHTAVVPAAPPSSDELVSLNVRLDVLAVALDRVEEDLRSLGYDAGADILLGMIAAFKSELPRTESQIAWSVKLWAAARNSRPPDAEQWASMLLFAAASALTGRSEAMKHMLFGIAQGLEGKTIAPSDSSPAWRMGLKAVHECRGHKIGDTQLVVQIDPDPIESEPEVVSPPLIERIEPSEPIEENTTPFDENTTPFEDKTTPWIPRVVAPAMRAAMKAMGMPTPSPEPDTPVARRPSKAPANEEDLTKPKNLRAATTKLKEGF